MDLRYSDADERFRTEVRAWLADALPKMPPKPGPHDWAARRAYDTQWQRMLHDAGYAGINWPAEYGGRGASPTEHLIFLEETERAGAPYVGVNFVGLLHAGPTLIAEGTPAQKQRHLPKILSGEEVWCQGFSEPGAGSDLASLKTRAMLDGDHYVVNGQKIWTSFAHVADFGELLVRTDPDAPKHKGITWLILPMDAPGIEVRPLRTIAGSSEFSEVFFTDVRIPIENRVGKENDGWRVAMVTFSFERGTAFVGELVRSMKLVEELAELARRLPRGRGTAWDDGGVRRELGTIAAQLDGLWHLTKRTITESERSGVPGIGGSIFKLYYSEVRHHLGDLAMKILGTAALATEDEPAVDHVRGWIHAMSISIAAGTTQIQRNILSERVLGMPKEPS
ncbi:MAG TPA: acyl-CoA dehydrogenase family protein [Actinomycetota bacterium]|nr:acyl-CoA dehydrogenase family protein [Actinomycetota bacterium]